MANPVSPRKRFYSTAVAAIIAAALVHGSIPIVFAQEPAPAAENVPKLPDHLKAKGPMPPPWVMQRCLELITSEKFAEARALLEPIVADHPGWPKANLYLGITYQKEERYAEARPYFERALEVDQNYHTVRVFLGWCLYYLGELDKAKEMFEAFLAAQPDHPEALFALALINFDEDEIETARQRLTSVVDLAQKKQDIRTEAKARARLADVYLRLNNLEEARKHLERSIELVPENDEPYFKLSRVLDRLGDKQGASKAREKYKQVQEQTRATQPRGERRPGE